MLRFHHAWLIAVSAAVLVACSGVKLAYNQLDWYVPHYVEGYVDLDGAQNRMLKDYTAQLLNWHCGTQLARYAGSLRDMNRDFQNGHVTQARLAAHYHQVFEYWQAIKSEAAPHVAALLATATNAQIEELFASFDRENRKFKAEFVERPEADRRKAAAKTMRENLERWIGDLTPTQREALAAWSANIVLNAPDRLAFRQRWQAALRGALDHRDDARRFTATVQTLVAHPERYWDESYASKNERLREQILELLVTIGATLTPPQREHLARRTDRWVADFEQLACAPKPVQITAVVPEQVRAQ